MDYCLRVREVAERYKPIQTSVYAYGMKRDAFVVVYEGRVSISKKVSRYVPLERRFQYSIDE